MYDPNKWLHNYPAISMRKIILRPVSVYLTDNFSGVHAMHYTYTSDAQSKKPIVKVIQVPCFHLWAIYTKLLSMNLFIENTCVYVQNTSTWRPVNWFKENTSDKFISTRRCMYHLEQTNHFVNWKHIFTCSCLHIAIVGHCTCITYMQWTI